MSVKSLLGFRGYSSDSDARVCIMIASAAPVFGDFNQILLCTRRSARSEFRTQVVVGERSLLAGLSSGTG